MDIKSLPRSFDPRKLARQGREYQVCLALNLFSRLIDNLSDDKGEVRVALHFSLNEERRVLVTGHVEATLKMVCQRCLDIVDIPVRAELNLMGVLTDEQANALPEGYEPMFFGDEPVELIPLLEEELLLALPIMAYHPLENCSAQRFYTTETEEEALKAAEEAELELSNPFSVLVGLKSDIETQES